jgi:phosphate:Na+ symporter
VVGLFLGALITSIIQSSSATSVITIGLVNAGIISFKNSLGIIFGANVGTTVTAQLVAFKLTNFAPAFIILGFFLSLIRSRYSVIGKSIFYFGFVFFSLNLISSTLGPLQSDERVIALLTESQNIFYTAIAGALFTAIVQSSSVTTGLAVILVQNGLLSLENAVPIIIGANVGTTITALMSMFNLDSAAKKTALSHLIFNVSGAILFLPFSKQLISYFQNSNAEIALANIHLVINLVTSLIFTVLVTPFSKLIDKLISSNHHLDFPIIKFPEMKEEVDFSEIDNFVKTNQAVLFSFIKENYNLVTLSIETNYKNIYQTVDKRIDYMDYLENEFMTFFSVLINRISEDESSKKNNSVYESI